MSLLHYLSYVASGLLWLSELIEEHSRIAKHIGQRGIYVIILLHVLLFLFDSLPLHLVAFSIVCHVVYLQNFTPQWPMVSLTSFTFLASCAMVVIDHFLWFFHFARVTQDARLKARMSYRTRPVTDVPGFADIATFFGICVWLAPLFLFLSLSANDNALPLNLSGQSSVPNTPTVASRPMIIGTRGSLFKTLYAALPLDSLPRLRPRPKKRDSSQGIIAPPSPSPRLIPSAMSSPALERVPSMTHLPPSPLSPPRRSTDTSVLQRSDSPNLFQSNERASSPFSLAAPPRRTSGTSGSPSIRSTHEGRLEMRRVVSASHADYHFEQR
ncbi:hypothetical protein NM688_g544 [Phlebia brevispora]|uniref:Uncharacterized protein n=1 Tax=Phlebia brevispora TaxID=194682 RepID=A0ACC1TEA4_9APHY|nr:hypothetical protein NM688_g544 [Phlebia brevispora]